MIDLAPGNEAFALRRLKGRFCRIIAVKAFLTQKESLPQTLPERFSPQHFHTKPTEKNYENKRIDSQA